MQAVCLSNAGSLQRRFEHMDGSFIVFTVNRLGVAIFAAVSEAVAHGVTSAWWRSVDHLGYHGQSTHGGGTDAFRAQQRSVISRPAFVQPMQDLV